MPTRFLVNLSLIVALPAAAASEQTVSFADHGLLTFATRNAQTQLMIRWPAGQRHVISVVRDNTVAPSAEPQALRIVGTLSDSVIIVVDTYASIPGGLSQCKAGEESFLRVIQLIGNHAKQTYQLKLASCRDTVTPESDGVNWLPKSRQLRIKWLTGPSQGHHAESRTIQLSPKGVPLPSE